MNPRTRNLRRPSLLAATVLLSLASGAAAAAPAPSVPAVPPELEPWIEWVKEFELPPGECRAVEDATICVWPTRLGLNVTKSGGTFDLDVTAHDAQNVLLPGDDSRWPQDIRIDGKPAVVVDEEGTPAVRLTVGRHRVSGTFQWSEMPDSLAVPPEVALLELRRDGKPVPFPSRQEEVLRLLDDEEAAIREEEEAVEAEAKEPQEVAEDALRVEVSRWLRDGVPLTIVTRVDLRVSGKARELTLPYPLWDDAELLRVDSPLPLQFGAGRALVVQARSGSYTITLESVLARQPETLGPPQLPEPWPADEVWVWKAAAAGEAALGQVALSGGQAVDRSRTHAPAEWEGGATFRVTAKTPLAFEVLQRGVSETAPNELKLARVMWFDMDGRGWSVVDSIRGAMHRGTRLDLRAGTLGSAIINNEPQVVTEGADGVTGIEVRRAALDLTATWRASSASSALPVGGWSEPFDRVELGVELPRGWDILRISGPGSTRSTWIESWRPLEILMLLGVCALIGRLISPWSAIAALLGLGLAYTRSGDGFVELVLLIAALALLAAQLRREHGPWATRALQWAWLAGAALLTAWMTWKVPLAIRGVWRDGDSALMHRDLERELTELAELEVVGIFLVLAVYGLAWVLTRARGAGYKTAATITAGGGGAVLLLLMLTTTRGEFAPTTDSAVAQSARVQEAWEVTDEEAGGTGQRHKGEEGKMTKPKSKSKSGAYAMKDMKETKAEEDAEVWGGLAGTEVGEAYGVGGLGLVGTGRGGGGTGEGTIGLGNTGLIGKGGGGGTGSGYGRGAGAGFGGRGSSVPIVRQGKATVEGALDKDIIRRIVRAHINEIRYCYNQGLARDPSLRGRVEVQFTINEAGKVPTAVVASTTLKDASVGTCVAQAVKRWTFPKPKGGNVVVTYPFVLETDGPSPSGEPSAAPTDQRFVLDADLPKAPPSAVPQTGEGTPDASGGRWNLSIDRAVKPDETVSLWLLSPSASKALALLRALALWVLGFALVRAGWRAAWGQHSRETTSRRGASAAGVIAFFAIFGASQIASAAPSPELLEQLKERVTAERPLAPQPECSPECALVVRLGVDVAGQTLRLKAEVHMAGPGIYRLPGSFDAWMPQTVDVDGRPASELIALEGEVLVRLAEGVHTVELAGPIGTDELNLGLTHEPKRIDVKAKGWVVEGVDEDGHASTLHFLKEASSKASKPTEPDDGDAAPAEPGEPTEPVGDRVSQDLPPWLVVHRQIEIGPRWMVRTSITRQNHGPSPITVQVPLLAGEKMLEATAKIGDPKATIWLDRAGDTISWTSVLEQRDSLALTAPQASPWTEVWTVTCGEAWQCSLTGTPATTRDAGTSVHHPWPGETLTLALHRPAPVDGALLTVDRAQLRLTVSEAQTEARLSLTVRAATVTTRTLTLPTGAHLGSVKIGGADVPIAKDATELRLPFQPGVSEVAVEWKQDDGVATVYNAPSVSLGGRAVNARVTVEFVDNTERIVLWTGGSARGPIVWLWPWFGALALLALLLGRVPGVPLRSWQWFLLGLGFSAVVLPVLVAWFLLVAWRPAWARRIATDHGYNALQFGLGLLTVAVLLVTLATGKELLTSPVWTLVHNWNNDGELLRWYADRVEDATPSAWIVSMPASLWRGLWVLWAVWIAWQSIGWGRWAWRSLGEGGWFRTPPPPPPIDEPAESAEAAPRPDTATTPDATADPGPTP